MTLHWGSNHIASCLPEELLVRFHESYADPTLSVDAVSGLPIYNGKTGEMIMNMAAEKPMRVSRKKMRNLFSEGIDVQYGKAVEAVSTIDEGENKGKVKVVFKDGTEAVGDVVVGCDGQKSKVRESICGKEAAELTEVPLYLFNFTQKFTAEQALELRKLNPMFWTSIHPDHGTMFWVSSKLSNLILLFMLDKINSPRRTRSWQTRDMVLPDPADLDKQSAPRLREQLRGSSGIFPETC